MICMMSVFCGAYNGLYVSWVYRGDAVLSLFVSVRLVLQSLLSKTTPVDKTHWMQTRKKTQQQ